MMEQTGFVEVQVGARCDTFGEASGEKKARLFDVYGYAFMAQKPK